MSHDAIWLDATRETLAGYRKLIDGAVGQLSDEQFFARPQPELNSVATLLRHLGGNLNSRWMDFLAVDGEKPTRDRDLEFANWHGSREELMQYFDAGWRCLTDTLQSLETDDLQQTVTIRGEAHTVPQAILRSLTHISYHVGQILMIARISYGDDRTWQWLTIRPGGSRQHNESTWGSSASRGVAGQR